MTKQKPVLEVLTARQKEILDIIAKHLAKEGLPPSIREICRDSGIASLNGANDHLKALYRKGWLRHMGKGRARGYTLSVAAAEVLPGAPRILEPLALKKLNNFIRLKKLNDFIRDFPDNVLADLKSCGTPQKGALLIVNIVDDILSGDY